MRRSNFEGVLRCYCSKHRGHDASGALLHKVAELKSNNLQEFLFASIEDNLNFDKKLVLLEAR
jgi:hypothetical protein